MATARIRGFDVNYRRAGRGDDVILIHGLAANHAFWNLQLLLPLGREFRVTTYDLRGHGYSDMPASGYTSADLEEDLVALLDHLAIERAHLVGHSFGGVVALHAAVRNPGRVRSLTILDSRVRALQPVQRLIDWPDWQTAKEDLREQGIELDENEDDAGLKLLEALAAPEARGARESVAKRPLFVPFSGWSAGNRSAARWHKLLTTTTAREDIRSVAGLTTERIRGVRVPMLAIYGEHSRAMKTFSELKRIQPACSGYIMSGVGHFYPAIRPVEVARLVLQFLGAVPEVASPTTNGSKPSPAGEAAVAGPAPIGEPAVLLHRP